MTPVSFSPPVLHILLSPQYLFLFQFYRSYYDPSIALPDSKVEDEELNHIVSRWSTVVNNNLEPLFCDFYAWPCDSSKYHASIASLPKYFPDDVITQHR